MLHLVCRQAQQRQTVSSLVLGNLGSPRERAMMLLLQAPPNRARLLAMLEQLRHSSMPPCNHLNTHDSIHTECAVHVSTELQQGKGHASTCAGATSTGPDAHTKRSHWGWQRDWQQQCHHMGFRLQQQCTDDDWQAPAFPTDSRSSTQWQPQPSTLTTSSHRSTLTSVRHHQVHHSRLLHSHRASCQLSVSQSLSGGHWAATRAPARHLSSSRDLLHGGASQVSCQDATLLLAPSSDAAACILALSPSGPPRTSILVDVASAIQWVHDTTGLPWWVSIPVTTWAVRTTLLPFSMWQAKTVRTNFMVYKESVALTDKQLGVSNQTEEQDKRAESDPGAAAAPSRRSKLLLSNFLLLRSKLGAPHPAWILINPLVQLPVFALLGASLRMMGGVGWPGLATGGAAWFSDLTQVALVPGSILSEPVTPWELPMGPLGPVLPLAMLCMTLTSLRLGFGAAGAGGGALMSGAATSPPQDWVGRGMRMLPFVLGGLSVLNTWVAMQVPHAAMMHWLASSSFTLGLQLALQRPAFRAAFNLPSPAEIQASLARAVNQRLLQLSEAGGVIGPGRGYAVSSLPEALIKQVSNERDADVLVILGAQHSAQKRYREALYCLDRALQIQPHHVRAHYSRGQVFSLNNRWGDAESCFRRAADLAEPGPEKGQAQYCVATALHSQGKLEDAQAAYRDALELWKGQPVVSYSLANALIQSGRLHEAKAVIAAALHVEPQALDSGSAPMSSSPAGPFHKPFLSLVDQINMRLKGSA